MNKQNTQNTQINISYENLIPFSIRSRNKNLTEISTKDDLLKLLPKFQRINDSLVQFLNNIDLTPSITVTELHTHIQKYQTQTSQFKTLFWTRRGYTLQEAKDKISEIQSKNSKKVKPKRKDQNPMCEEYYIKKGFSKEDSEIKVQEMINKTSNLREQFWVNKGFTEQEAKTKISEIQKDNSKKLWENEENVKKWKIPTMVKYWTDKGFSEQEAKIKISKRQSTFSREKCIKTHGLEKGIAIWKERQIKWLSTLDSKSDEEKERIRKDKGKNNLGIYCETYFKRNGKSENGILYYIRFWNNETEFWKIGITKNRCSDRWTCDGGVIYGLLVEIIFEKEMTLYEAFKEEQRILDEYKDRRITVDHNGFHSTECFTEDVLLNNLKK